jgi:glycosyltransferase involved in cell wall biosynthesis
MPGYQWRPSGGVRVVYEYANRLARRGHQVTVVHPRRLKYAPCEQLTAYQRARKEAFWLRGVVSRPSLDWQPIGSEVKLSFVATSDPRYIPDGDAIFATAWHTVDSVLRYPPTKGKKCYLIQHYEVWQGAKDLVDATWRAPLRKIVIAKWLKELGQRLGCQDVTYIPNAINHEIFRCTRPIEGRPRRIAMMFSREAFKGSADGIMALEMVKKRFPDLKAVFFSTSRPDESIPQWVEFHRNPPQHFIVDEIYGRSSILLCPSLSEGWGLPAAEGSACGCAVVSTDNGGVSEFIQHGVTGLLSAPGDPKSLAENLCRLLQDEPLRVQLAKAANSFISRFSWEKSTDLMEDFLGAPRSLEMASL